MGPYTQNFVSGSNIFNSLFPNTIYALLSAWLTDFHTQIKEPIKLYILTLLYIFIFTSHLFLLSLKSCASLACPRFWLAYCNSKNAATFWTPFPSLPPPPQLFNGPFLYPGALLQPLKSLHQLWKIAATNSGLSELDLPATMTEHYRVHGDQCACVRTLQLPTELFSLLCVHAM